MLGELAKVQRREYYRYKCLMDARLRVVSDNEYDTGIPDNISVPEEELDWDPVKILDVSGGGAKIVARNHLDKNEVVKLMFTAGILEEKLNFNLFARILSSTQMQNKAGLYEQRLEFLKTTQEDKDDIVRFIFENERMARAKEARLK